MKDESMVEVLARAIAERQCAKDQARAVRDGLDTLLAVDGYKEWAREIARSCLQALLDHGPTKEMLDAGVATRWYGGRSAAKMFGKMEKFESDCDDLAKQFRAMISKALGK